ncbi:universal stress protein [Microbacterium sp.]|uniref:universal stress protein n=1 Tax=Microbacterium sp. TaxID=51671 RepID=UPI002E37541A|nr:universal stress protein [Microbacterium sp.]HEX5730980.1 universal stress protein [Microbacterium sp.]
MTYVVGYAPHKHDRSAVELACQLARSLPEPVVAVSVVPRGWGTPVAAGTDREFEQWAAGEGADSAALAAADLAQHPLVEGSAVWVAGRSVPQALLEETAERDAAILVVGSGDDAEPGSIRLTSKTDRLVHSSTVPVAIAPRGYHTSRGVTRITVAFRDDDASWSLLTRVAEISRRASAQLRVVTFLVRPSRRPVTSDVSHAETQVIDLWAVQAAAAQAEAQAHLNSMGLTDDSVHLHIAEGADWAAAVTSVDWVDGDVLVLGSSSTHRLAQVFLGSSASKIIRHSPVPVIIVPGSATG